MQVAFQHFKERRELVLICTSASQGHVGLIFLVKSQSTVVASYRQTWIVLQLMETTATISFTCRLMVGQCREQPCKGGALDARGVQRAHGGEH